MKQPKINFSQLYPKTYKSFLVLLAYVLIIAAFLAVKWSYFRFDNENIFHDTLGYLSVAIRPIYSLSFWAGERPFTLPLLFKILGVDFQNYQSPDSLMRIAYTQVWISIICWLVLGFTVERRFRNRWMGIATFGLVLVFSLVYEISRWDLLLIAESLTFSLFALMLAGWVWLLVLSTSPRRTLRAYLILLVIIVITVLYSFARDASLYFVIMGAVLFAIASLFHQFGLHRPLILIYLASTILLWFGQNASINTANRWQIYIYDQYALRLTDTPELVEYFKKAGLPMMEKLYKKPTMRGQVYQEMLLFDHAYEPVRQWTTAHGKATYVGYLLTHPLMTLGQPLEYAYELLNGASETLLYGRSTPASDGYRRPLIPDQRLPRYIRGLTKIFFPVLPVWAYGVLYLFLLFLAGWALLNRWDPVIWLVIFALLITLYPLMILVWFGDPLEMWRHSLQNSISFRLAGWLAFGFTVDHWISLYKKNTRQVQSTGS
jgi:hypothetical protein